MARKKQEAKVNIEKEKKGAIRLNGLFRDMLNNISGSIYQSDTANQTGINRIDSEIDKIISEEISNTKSITTDEMSTFLVKLFNEQERNGGYGNTNGMGIKDLDDVFMNETTGLFQFFQERYKNKNLLYEDLAMISSQLYELDEAISTTRDAIITADDVSQIISRKLSFGVADDHEKTATYRMGIEKLENDLGIHKKIKNMIIPYTLTYGNYYVYTCPYNKLFEQHYKKKAEDVRYSNTVVSESIDASFVDSLKESLGSAGIKLGDSTSKIIKEIKEYANGIEVYNDNFSIPLVEGTDVTAILSDDVFKEYAKKTMKGQMKSSNKIADGVIDTSKINGMFDEVSGCYIRYIEPKRIIPVEMLDTTIGYYYIHEVDFETQKAPFSTTIRVTNNATGYNTNELDAVLFSKIADSIVSAFDKKFLEKNVKFKELIMNALTYNDLYSRQIKFQFIPKEYITEFKVNEDENGNGQSVLTKSLFYAKLYLSLLIFKMITIITKSNDTKVYYVKNSGIDQNITNKVQEVARSVKARQINFMDLLNYNSIISKIGANKEIFMPVGRNGERGIEFDILSGQDVQLNTDLMEMLRTAMIGGTGVPSVIMNFINEADYSRSIVMANTKFVGRVISYQIDFNPSITEFYRKLIKFSNIGIPEEMIDSFMYTLNTPKVLNTSNMTDILNAADMVVANAIKAATGENADQTDTNNRIKDIMYNKLLREYVPSINWSMVDDIYAEAKMEVERHNLETKGEENV